VLTRRWPQRSKVGRGSGDEKPIMKRFTATLTFVQYNRADVWIKARSLKEARCKADEIGADEVDDWNPVDGEVSVESVTERKPRKKNSRTRRS
jgi:hypothetical protein